MKETKSNYCEHCGEFHDSVQDHVSLVKVGEPVPDFEFEAYHKDAITTMSLSSLRGTWVILVFYPADFTFICPTELEELAKLYPKFQELNAEVISVSTDNPFTHKAWHNTSEGIRAIEYPMAADHSGKLSYAFGVLIEGGEPEHVPDEGLALPGTLIIVSAGIPRPGGGYGNSIGSQGRE